MLPSADILETIASMMLQKNTVMQTQLPTCLSRETAIWKSDGVRRVKPVMKGVDAHTQRMYSQHVLTVTFTIGCKHTCYCLGHCY